MGDRGGYGGIGFGTALFLLFLGLKLGHVIDWSWWWITAPIWAPAGIVLAIIAGAYLVGAAAEGTRERRYERERKERQRMARSADRSLYDEWGKPRG